MTTLDLLSLALARLAEEHNRLSADEGPGAVAARRCLDAIAALEKARRALEVCGDS